MYRFTKVFVIIFMLVIVFTLTAWRLEDDPRNMTDPYPGPEATATKYVNPYPPPEPTDTPDDDDDNDDNDFVIITATLEYRPTNAPTETMPTNAPTETLIPPVSDEQVCKDIKYGEDGMWYYCCKQFNLACHPGG